MITIKIYIDFDGTIYNTTKLYQEYINLLKKYNINEEYFQNKLNKNYQKNKNLNTITEYIINDYNLNNSIQTELNNIIKNNLIYKDVIPFLEKYHNKYDLILLTLGNKEFQEKKIKSSNINK